MFKHPINENGRKRLSAALFFFLSGVISASWSSRIPDIQHKLSLNNVEWGTVLFSLPVGLLIGLPVSSWLIARFGSRMVMLVAGIFFAILLSLLSWSFYTWQLIISLFLFGFFRTQFSISVNTTAIEIQQLYKKPIISTFHGVWSVASLLAAGIGTVMITYQILPRYHFLIISTICILFFIIGFRKKDESGVSAATEVKPFFIKPDKFLFLLGLMAFCAMLVEGTMFDWGVNYFDKIVMADKSTITAGYTSFVFTMAAGRLAGDRIVARFGTLPVLVANGIMMFIGVFLAVIFPYFLPAVIGFLLVGAGDAIIVPLVYSLAAKSKIMKPGYAIASVTFIGYIGFLLGPLIIGSVSEWLNMRWAFGLVGVLSLCITFLTFAIKKYI